MTKNPESGFLSLLGLLLTLAIIFILVIISFNIYFKFSAPSESLNKISSEADPNTPNYKSILDSSRKKVEDINKQMLERSKELENITK
ncbi:MAG: hypothetical protein AB1472_00245 [Candidatus Omnitrophota bacterium]